MKILEKYIIKEFFAPFLFGIFIFTTILVSGGVLFKIIKLIIEYQISPYLAIKLFLLSLPTIVILTFPMAVLLASLLSFGRLSSDGEVIAMYAGGIGFSSIIFPILFLSFLISIFSVVIGESLVPKTKLLYNKTLREEVKKIPLPPKYGYISLPSEHSSSEKFIYYGEFDEKNKILKEIYSADFKGGKPSQTIYAKYAKFKDNIWHFFAGTLHQFDAEGNLKNILHFKEKTIKISTTPEEIKSQQKEPEEMKIQELKFAIFHLHLSPDDIKRKKSQELKVELHTRYSIPFASFIFALVGIPLAMKKIRTQTGVGVGISALIIFVYYVILTLLTTYGKIGAISPLISAWGANFIFGALGILLIVREKNK